MNSTLQLSFRGVARLTMTCLVLLALLSGFAFAQETTGSIAGQVVDASGAAVPNAKIEVTGPSLPAALTVNTDSTGNYKVASVPAGSYVVTASAAGFSVQKKTSVPVTLGRTSRIDFKMEVGQVTESVVVSADAAMVDTTSSSSAVNVDRSFFDLIPKGRSFYDLVNLAPGARNEGKAGGYQVDGASGSENVFYLDGMEVTNVQYGTLSSQNRIPVEMVQQVQVKNGVMEAQYGGAMGGVVNAVVRSGSNEWHGQGGFYYSNDSMSARPRPTLEMDPLDANRAKVRYFQNAMDDYSTWNPVFSFGGPILKNKLFLFAGYMPTMTTTNRKVTFLSNNQTGDFSSKYTQRYLTGKLDYAPASKLRMSGSWIWNPNYTRGSLPARQGTDSPNRNWAGLGDYTAGNMITGQVDYLATSKLIVSFRGGYNYTNNTNRYAGSSTTFIYSTANTMFSDIPADMILTSAGWKQQGTSRRDFDIYKRVNLNADASYLANWKGQHNIKFGWQTNRLSNSVQNLSYPTGYYRFYWNQSYRCITTQCTGTQRGAYGFYRWYTYGDFGDASSDNQGLFFQDNWRVNKHLTLNLGLRSEREFLPSFAKTGITAAPPIEFGWGKKISPRIGGAWDPKGDGKMRVYASWGYFYDVMKYEMPRGSFGGALYITNYYSLDSPSVYKQLLTAGYPTDPTKLPGRLFESVDWRIPSNDPKSCEKQGLDCKGMTIDPNLKPMKQRMLDLGYDYSINSSLVASLRYTNRRLIRTIEDVGTLGAGGEVYYIANPGEGITIAKSTWEPGFPVTPKAIRNYDALELRLDKRFAKNYQYAASYTWSRSYGNYSGLASSDEDGRTSPNVNRYFDLPWLGYTEKGTMSEGRLATDRPHTLKFFGGYTQKSPLGNTTISPNVQLYSGTPLTTQLNAISSVPVYPFNRGDMGRTPVFYNFDMNLMHDFVPLKSHESLKVRFEFSIFNLFNSSIVTNKDQTILHPDDGQLQFAHDADIFKGFNTQALMKAQDMRVSPLYGLANGFQGPRSTRLQLTFFF
ncbi:MAG: TonB-dependent receptor [Candidatus Solibacter usitatus]|nr:TonB-dependent receptor [Candidatus Solibacter usitatus]